MPNRIRCLLVEAEPESVRQIDLLGRKTGLVEVRWKTDSLASGIEILRKQKPEMAIVGLDASPDEAIELVASASMEFPALYLLALSARGDAELILRAMRAGAHDFLRKPVQENEFRAAVDKVVKLKAARSEPRRNEGTILSVFSNKGGNGGTTIAANLADAAVRYHGKNTVVVDLVLAHGDVTMFFNVTPAYSIMDLARNAAKADHEFLHSLLVRHASGVYVLADPPSIEDADQISATQVREVLVALRSMFDLVIVDTPHQFDERTLTALEMSDVVLLVSLLNLPSLRNTKRCLDLFARVGLAGDRVRLVLNRYLPSDEIPKGGVEGIMSRPVYFSIPNDYPNVIASINRGRLLREVAPDQEITRAFRRLASLLLGAETTEEGAPSGKKSGLLGKILRRQRGSP